MVSKSLSHPRKQRQGLLTDERQSQIFGLLRVPGVTVIDAAHAAGITRDSFYKWLRRGREDLDALTETANKTGLEAALAQYDKSHLYINFLFGVEKAYSLQKIECLSKIHSDKNGWQRYAWVLERRWPDEFALKTKTEITGKNGEPVQVEANVKIKLIGLIDSAASRIRETPDTKPALTEGSTSVDVRLDSVGTNQSAAS